MKEENEKVYLEDIKYINSHRLREILDDDTDIIISGKVLIGMIKDCIDTEMINGYTIGTIRSIDNRVWESND